MSTLLCGLFAQAVRHGGGGGADLLQLRGLLLVAADVAAEGAIDELEGELPGSAVGQPDDKGGGEELAQVARVLALAGEDLVLLVQDLALQLDPLLGTAEDILELLQRPQAELALAVELGHSRDRLGDRDQADRVAVVVGIGVAVAVARLFLVGIEGEDAFDFLAEGAGEGALGVAVVAFAQQRRRWGQGGPAAELEPVPLGIDLEEGVLGAGGGDPGGSPQRDQENGARGAPPP